MDSLSFSENYMLLLLNATNKYTDIQEAQYSTGVILGGIYDLLKIGCISENNDGHLVATNPLPKEYEHLKLLYEEINKHHKKISKLIDYYCCSPTTSNISPLINDMFNSLSKKGFVDVEVKKGIIRTKTICHLKSKKVTPIVESFQQGVLNKSSDEIFIFLYQMLSLADLLTDYFSILQRVKLKSVIKNYKKSEIWNMMKQHVDTIQSYNYMNAKLSGAFYSE